MIRRHDRLRRHASLLAAAYAEPRLRQLFPWVGMWELHFSRCTELRWTWDVPYIGPAAPGPDHSGAYYVAGPSRTQKAGRAASAQEAVAMVVARVPSNCGPAFVGTSEGLAEHERRHRQSS
ncbi:DUF6193 family natural product biosynthesis protein [Streptomyces sp. NPDC052496]|uniref:DUF6193 family natural product biosynthesis protein n=1 Tax=Streptomyces sp. NPDC052496 TaxID=3154951 RepID=UPI003429CC67